MSAICANCGKTTVLGRSRTHRRGVAGKRWRKKTTPTKRTFKANIQKYTILEKGKKKQIKLCAKCIKRRKRDSSAPFASI